MTVEDRIDDIFGRPPELGISLALVVLQGGEVIAERYGTSPDTAIGPGGPVDADSRLVSWSTAKSIVHGAVGVLVKDGAIDPAAPAAVPAWAGTDKAGITLLDLLEMRPGLRFVED
ncbi:MAG TPA: serine hydrolase, partial [Ilumatobacteraceae bacterium]|nr:serine hydrolase [Ilumatobacteraceae bacterium]